MVTTGAGRSVAVKILYQTGFEAPIYVTLLYLLGQSLSLLVYACQYFKTSKVQTAEPERTNADTERAAKQEKEWGLPPCNAAAGEPPDGGIHRPSNDIRQITSVHLGGSCKIGSAHGLQRDFEESYAARVHKLPFLLFPLIPGICNMFNSLFRWASLIYIAASVGEMLISGMELALSVLAARLIRRRLVSRRRWLGVGVVVVGITLIGLADVLLGSKDESSSPTAGDSRESLIGIFLIIGQCVLSVLQDIAEEIFMQAGEFPPTLLLGMEGVFGFMITLVLFFALGSVFEKDPSETLQDLQEDKAFLISYSIGLTLLFTVTGIFNIKATQVTSAMTRNVWKNLRTVLVWVITLLIFYLGGNTSLGEVFVIPESLVILAGFAVMVAGIFVYYSQKDLEDHERKRLQEEIEMTAERQV